MPEITERQKASARVRTAIKRILRHEDAVLVLILLALIGATGYLTRGLSLRIVNVVNVFIQSSMRGIAAIGEAFVLLSGGIDLSVGGIGLFAGILGAELMTAEVHKGILGYAVAPPIGILAMLAIGTCWGMLNGLGVSRAGVPALIVTLAMWEITKGAAFQLCQGLSITRLPAGLAFFGTGDVAGFPVPVLIFVVVVVVAYFVLNRTAFGRSVYATGGNPVSAWLCGIDIRKTQFAVYAISGFLSGLAAVVWIGRIMTASMVTLTGLELDAIAAVVIGGVSLAGGRGSIIGVLVGVIMIGVINNSMSILGASPAVMGIAKGAIIFSAVAIDCARRRRG